MTLEIDDFLLNLPCFPRSYLLVIFVQSKLSRKLVDHNFQVSVDLFLFLRVGYVESFHLSDEIVVGHRHFKSSNLSQNFIPFTNDFLTVELQRSIFISRGLFQCQFSLFHFYALVKQIFLLLGERFKLR